MKFDTAKTKPSIIKVIGVGGGGSNAVNHMFQQGIRDVDFILCNTDSQALALSEVPVKIQLGERITEGRGAGSVPSVGKDCAMDNLDELRSLLQENTKMLFITAGMGGGTGTGAAPVIASIAKELGILTVGIVTLPFAFEGRKRKNQAEEGIEELRKYVDTLLIICNEKLRELYGDSKLSEAFKKADNILTTAAKGIAEIITVPGYVNVDFEDVKTVMKNSGVAIMGTGMAEGENRAITSVEMALSSPLLNDSQIIGARNILLYIASGNDEISMDEVSDITDYIQREAGSTAEIIWGNGYDESLDNMISVTIIATGFESSSEESTNSKERKNKLMLNVDEGKKNEDKKQNEDGLTDIQITSKSEKSLAENSSSDKQSEIPQPRTFQLEIDVPQDNNYNNKAVNDSISASDNNQPELNKINKTTKQSDADNSVFDEQSAEFNEVIEKKSDDRSHRLRDFSMKLKTPEGLDELESQPAYLRREVNLFDVTPSNESSVSNYTISNDQNDKGKISGDNSFLNKSVD